MILHDPLDWRRSTKHAGIESFDNCRKEAIPFDYRGAIISGSKRLKSRVEQTKESCLILSNPFKENPSGKDRSCLLSVQFVIIVAVVVIVVIPLALPPPSPPPPPSRNAVHLDYLSWSNRGGSSRWACGGERRFRNLRVDDVVEIVRREREV